MNISGVCYFLYLGLRYYKRFLEFIIRSKGMNFQHIDILLSRKTHGIAGIVETVYFNEKISYLWLMGHRYSALLIPL